VDVGTLNGYREAMRVLAQQNEDPLAFPISNQLAAQVRG
jgi:hypothetical protein